MTFVIVVLLGVSIIVNLSIYRKYVTQCKDLEYVHTKLEQIILEKTSERIMINTDDTRMKSMLIQINQLLDHNQTTVANHRRIKRSMQKMLSNISHDLKTPLTVVRGYTEIILKDRSLSHDKKNTLLQIVDSKTEEVLTLINRFFELAKLESEDKAIEISKVNISEICRKTILGFYEILSSKDYEVCINIPEKPVFVLGNEMEIERILNNLISNAIHYGKDGKVVGIELIFDQDYVYIEVFDRGKGISDRHKEHVFERLYTMDDSRNKLYQGSGLGLAITKRLVEQLGGKITLESIPFKKTSFIVQFKRFKYEML